MVLFLNKLIIVHFASTLNDRRSDLYYPYPDIHSFALQQKQYCEVAKWHTIHADQDFQIFLQTTYILNLKNKNRVLTDMKMKCITLNQTAGYAKGFEYYSPID